MPQHEYSSEVSLVGLRRATGMTPPPYGLGDTERRMERAVWLHCNKVLFYGWQALDSLTLQADDAPTWGPEWWVWQTLVS